MNAENSRYREWADRHTDLPLFFQPWWLDALAPEWKAALCLRGQEVEGAWPYFLSRRRGIIQCVNPPFTPYLGPWLDYPGTLHPAQRPGWENRVIQALWTQIPREHYSLMGFWPGLFPLFLTREKPWRGEWRQTYWLDLREGEEEIRAGMSENLRRKLKKGGVGEIREPEDAWDSFWDFYCQAMMKKGLAPGQPPGGLTGLWEQGRSRGQLQWLGVHDGEDWLALIWLARDRKRTYYLGGARNPDRPDPTALARLLWQAIRMACQRGQEVFDFEGSMDPGVERFFQSFGARRQPYLALRRPGPFWWEAGRQIRGWIRP